MITLGTVGFIKSLTAGVAQLLVIKADKLPLKQVMPLPAAPHVERVLCVHTHTNNINNPRQEEKG